MPAWHALSTQREAVTDSKSKRIRGSCFSLLPGLGILCTIFDNRSLRLRLTLSREREPLTLWRRKERGTFYSKCLATGSLLNTNKPMVQVLPYQRLSLAPSRLPSCSDSLSFSVSPTAQSLGQVADSGLDCAFSPRAQNLHLCVIVDLKNVKITYP